ncbi:MAG: protein kinase [Ktedonobacteraceae bacterium]|nr:protein kinase [Ktedonobacteraceae bacterium]
MPDDYSSDPEHMISVNNTSLPPREPEANTPESPLASSALPGAVFSSAPSGGQSVSMPSSTPSSDGRNAVYQRRLMPGAVLSANRYRIEKLAASGGMGAVYRAIDTRFNRPCAVKEMLDEFHQESDRQQAIEWFSREATLLLDLNHPCIPRVRDFFLENGKHYLVMDFIEGRTLSDVLEKEGNIPSTNGARGVPEARARSWAQQLCNVLAYLHRQNPPIIFRDLKPSNIMVADRDEIKLIDFGIARTFQSQRQATIIMTIGYAPPEQLHGMPEPRSDIYALGATLHRVLTHHEASNNKPSIFSFPPLRLLRPDISPAFEQIVLKALNPDTTQRWASATDMERALMNLPPVSVAPPMMQSGSQGNSPQRLANPQTPASGSVPISGSNREPTPSHPGTTGPAGPHILAARGHLTGARIEAAYTEVQLAYTLEPNNPLVHKIFGQIFARRVPAQTELALRAYRRSLELKRDDAETHKLIGDISLYLTQKPIEAIPAYAESLRLNANDFETHLRLGQCYEKTNQLELALRAYQEAARLAPAQPPHPEVYFSLGQMAMRLNKLLAAERAFVQVLFINPADHQTRFLLCQVYEQENKLEEAYRQCSYVIQPLAANPAVKQTFDRLRTSLGR